MRKKLQFEEEHDSYNERNFLLCKSCFWCASFLSKYKILTACPTCMNFDLESMPLSFDETYTFGYDPLQGVSLGFWNQNSKR
jgi:hypothetical protein